MGTNGLRHTRCWENAANGESSAAGTVQEAAARYETASSPKEKAQQWLCERAGSCEEMARRRSHIRICKALGTHDATAFRTASSAPMPMSFRETRYPAAACACTFTPSAARSALPDCLKRFKCRKLLATSCRGLAVAPDSAPLCSLHM